MAEYRIKDRNGRELVVSGKEQLEQWVAVGYAEVTDDAKAVPTKKAAPRKSAAKKK